MADTPHFGQIGWLDLTVDDAPAIRDFYSLVVGWRTEGVDMGDYEDFVLLDAGGEGKAGVCHARGGNAGLPKGWLVYFTVESLDESLATCASAGGKVLREPANAGGGKYAIIADPSGATCALYENASG